MNKKKLIVANWKMNPKTLREAKTLFGAIRTVAGRQQNVQTVITPPSIYISELAKVNKGHRLSLGAQDVFYEREGAHTGEVSAAMLKNLKIPYVIVGHSERRAMGETDEIVAKKVKAAFKEKLYIILCVGEHTHDDHGEYLHFLRIQIKHSLAGINKSNPDNLIIAYEPIWAIGDSGKADTPEETLETILYIRKVLAGIVGKTKALSLPILYGGSVNQKNAENFLNNGGVDGLLVGRASLNAKTFGSILQTANKL